MDRHGRFRRSVHERIRKITAREHVSVLPLGVEPVEVGDSSAILASVPWVHLEPGACRGCRRSLRLSAGDSSVVLSARTRGVPRATSVGARSVERVPDDRGETLAVSCLDRTRRAIHLLVDVDTAELLESDGPDPAGAAAEALFGRPLARLIDEAGDGVHTGAEVAARAARLLLDRDGLRTDLSRRELELLRRMQRQVGRLPRPLQLRLELFERETGPGGGSVGSPEVPAERVEREVRRLERLVASRACGMIRLTDDGIQGIVGPRPLRGGWWTGGVRFALHPGARPREPYLQFSDPRHPERPPLYPCLGAAFEVLPRLGAEGDLFGLVDTVLNFVETNAVGAAPWDQWPSLPEPFPF